jgi:hypothetical protein
MQKFFNNLILRIIHDSSISNTSHHPQFGEERETGAILVTVIPVCFVEEIRRERVGCVAKLNAVHLDVLIHKE